MVIIQLILQQNCKVRMSELTFSILAQQFCGTIHSIVVIDLPDLYHKTYGSSIMVTVWCDCMVEAAQGKTK